MDTTQVAAMQVALAADIAANNAGVTNEVEFEADAAAGVVIHTTTTQVVVCVDAAYLMGLSIHTALVGTLTLTGLVDDTGAARNFVLPIGAVGELLYGSDLIFPTGLKLTLSSATDADKVLVAWRKVFQA